MKEGGVIRCELPRHPLLPLHPATRAGLIEVGAPARPAGAALGPVTRRGFALRRRCPHP